MEPCGDMLTEDAGISQWRCDGAGIALLPIAKCKTIDQDQEEIDTHSAGKKLAVRFKVERYDAPIAIFSAPPLEELSAA